MECTPWVLAVDLDGTLWDHPDVTSLQQPFRPLGAGLFTSSDGVVVTVNMDVVELVERSRAWCAIPVTLSWNDPSHALEALKVLGLHTLFDYHGIAPHPWKGRVLASILKRVERERGVRIPACRIVYIDDRDIHLKDVEANVGSVVYVRYGRIKGFDQLVKAVFEGLASCVADYGRGNAKPPAKGYSPNG